MFRWKRALVSFLVLTLLLAAVVADAVGLAAWYECRRNGVPLGKPRPEPASTLRMNVPPER